MQEAGSVFAGAHKRGSYREFVHCCSHGKAAPQAGRPRQAGRSRRAGAAQRHGGALETMQMQNVMLAGAQGHGLPAWAAAWPAAAP